jgi:acetyl-CoA carboxylase biotin carboxyl carrier protein
MTLDEIKALIGAMGRSDLTELQVEKDGWTLRLVRDPQPAAREPGETPAPRQALARPPRPAPVSAEPPADSAIRAPLAGVVHLRPSPEAPPFVSPGATIEAGATICTVEAMKMFNAIRAERSGIVEAILVASGDEVEAGQPLARIL